MDEKRVDIKIFTVLFFVILIGFIGFLVYQGYRESEYKSRIVPKERFKKNKDDVSLYIPESVTDRV